VENFKVIEDSMQINSSINSSGIGVPMKTRNTVDVYNPTYLIREPTLKQVNYTDSIDSGAMTLKHESSQYKLTLKSKTITVLDDEINAEPLALHLNEYGGNMNQ
jgi:hypothetical protein